MNSSRLLHRVLVEPSLAAALSPQQWNAVLRAARSEALIGSLAVAVRGLPIPDTARRLLEEAFRIADYRAGLIRYEAEQVQRALEPTGIPIILMKGAAYLLADLPAHPGRLIGDLDIMVPRAQLAEAEAALLSHGWRQTKARGSYDDAYYREWMHELPPLAHERRGLVVDLHHTILPQTARLTPDPGKIVERGEALDSGLHVMSPEDMLLHAAVHVAYDGDFQGGTRNLWDIDRLFRHFGEKPGFHESLLSIAAEQELSGPLLRALRLARALYETPIPPRLNSRMDLVDRLALRKLAHRDAYGLPVSPLSDFALFVRGHWLRMPPLMLARHLTTKWRAQRHEARPEVRAIR